MSRFAPIYLKVNRRSRMSQRCMRWWAAFADAVGAEVHLLCDWGPEDLATWLPESLAGASVVPTDAGSRERVHHKVSPFWRPAGAAQMATFADAAERGYQTFWAIDGDDTLFLAEPEVVGERLLAVQDWVEETGADSASLDFYQTYQNHWSFGVACFRMEADYVGLLEGVDPRHVAETYPSQGADLQTWGTRDATGRFYPVAAVPLLNLDVIFQYLRDQGSLTARSFYLEDVYFLHAGMPQTNATDLSGFTLRGVYHWKNGFLWDDPIDPVCLRF
ncbi:hypothetical protein P5P86_18425 [Nocardioides sp. BP30]|uniref:hypothetical protein n=1 Tax=Nocardioides sp. BP30 TaxID=3036374 RepID=UPI0024692595|nr:hypothetical protein [Nocardioides sp. BP30]WGL51915.1 hypothetical protein P5P86_18425 [Nocardioides sp. BP30]